MMVMAAAILPISMVWWFCVKSAAAYKGREGLGLATAATGYTRKELIAF